MKPLIRTPPGSLRALPRSAFKLLLHTWLVASLTFLLVRGLPGNPIDITILELINSGVPERAARTSVANALRLDLERPLTAQYAEFMRNLARGDLGDSLVLAPGRPVRELVFQRLPWTLFSVGLSLIISLSLGSALGLLAAYRRGSWLDHLLTNTGAVLDAAPPLLVAVVLMVLLGVVWQVVPLSAMRGSLSPGVRPSFSLTFVADLLQHWLVPGAVYIISTTGTWLLAMRSSAVSALGEDYITVAHARGLSDWRIAVAYVGRSASLPLVSGGAIALGFAVGGSILIENIFVYQGVGQLLGEAIAVRDYPLMQGIFLVTTLAVLVATTLADLLQSRLDPRTRTTD